MLGIHGISRKMRRGSAFALLTALSWGFGFALMAEAIARIGWHFATLLEFDVELIAYAIALPFIKSGEVISRKTLREGLTNKFVLGAGFVQLIGVLAVNIGISKSSANAGTIVTAISSCYPIITIALALKHFKEKIGFVPLTGAVLGILGIVVLSI
jgi:drug/metabolite transporter (DMT)-like permease